MEKDHQWDLEAGAEVMVVVDWKMTTVGSMNTAESDGRQWLIGR